MPVLDLDLARRITEGVVALLSRWAPDAQPWPDDPAPASELVTKLRRRDLRGILYLPDLQAEPRWPELYEQDDSNKERAFIRIATTRTRVEYASAVLNGSLVHWESAFADVDGRVTFRAMDPDRHYGVDLAAAETLFREMGLTLIPPAALGLSLAHGTLLELLDPRIYNLYAAGQEVARLAEQIRQTKGVRSAAQAYGRVLALMRLGYDLDTLSATLEGRSPQSLQELSTWLAERPPPFSWTRTPRSDS